MAYTPKVVGVRGDFCRGRTLMDAVVCGKSAKACFGAGDLNNAVSGLPFFCSASMDRPPRFATKAIESTMAKTRSKRTGVLNQRAWRGRAKPLVEGAQPASELPADAGPASRGTAGAGRA